MLMNTSMDRLQSFALHLQRALPHHPAIGIGKEVP